MKKFFLLIFTFLLTDSSTAQKEDTLGYLIEAYHSTLEYYFSPTHLLANYREKEPPKFRDIWICAAIPIDSLPEKIRRRRLKWSPQPWEITTRALWPRKRNFGRKYYYIRHSYLSNDTLDIRVDYWTLIDLNGETMWGAGCRSGTYMPDGRFVRNPETDTWSMIPPQELELFISEQERIWLEEMIRKRDLQSSEENKD